MSIIKVTICVFFIFLFSNNVVSQDDEDERIFDDQVFIKMSYYACHRGTSCPHYEIIILGNGSMIYEGINDVKKIGTHQKQITKQKIAGLLTNLTNTQFFEREDTSSDCYSNIEVTGGGAYEEAMSVCVVSSHGPNTYIEVKFGNKHRKVDLENLFSDDYLKIKQMIIETAGVVRWVKKK